MINKSIVFEAPWQVTCTNKDETLVPAKGEVLVRTLYSLISTGTELACLSGAEDWFKMPAVPGYCCVSKVIEIGEDAPFAVGDILFHYGMHARYQLVSENPFNLVMKIDTPERFDLKCLPMLRMATIAMTSTRVSNIELGDSVLVSGLGLVGLMAAQHAKNSGATTVIGIDPSENRRETALKLGLDAAIAPAQASQTVKELTDGKGVNTAIEATGIPACAESCIDMVGYHGELILLGTPRGDYATKLAPFLRHTHLEDFGSIEIKGAHEWRIPIKSERYVKHSIERNTRICLKLLEQNKLQIEPLISHIIKPENAPEVYGNLNKDRNAYMGIVIDWEE